MKNHNHLDQHGDLRDIFAAVAMCSLMNQPAATHKWVAHQAYRYADYMLTNAMQLNTMRRIRNE